MQPAESPAGTDLRIERDGHVEWIRLDRPDLMNAVSAGTGRELLAAVRAAAADDAVRAIVITGSGRGFCAGADLSAAPERTTPSGRPDLEWVLRDIYGPLVMAIRSAPKPVIAAVNGAAVGVGFSIALACDLVIASERARFVAGFGKIGLSLDGGLSVLLAARAGLGRAAQLAFIGERLEADQALAWGVADELVAPDALEGRAGELAARLAAGPVGAHARSKALLQAGVLGALEAALDREASMQGVSVESDEFVEGAMAFLQKRAPDFVGGGAAG